MIRRLASFWYDFLVGDDWTIAAGAVAAIAAAYGLHEEGIRPWWLLPPVALAILATSIGRANRRGAR